VPFPLPNPDGCKDCNIKCPMKKGESYVYITQLPIMNEYPKVTSFKKIGSVYYSALMISVKCIA